VPDKVSSDILPLDYSTFNELTKRLNYYETTPIQFERNPIWRKIEGFVYDPKSELNIGGVAVQHPDFYKSRFICKIPADGAPRNN